MSDFHTCNIHSTKYTLSCPQCTVMITWDALTGNNKELAPEVLDYMLTHEGPLPFYDEHGKKLGTVSDACLDYRGYLKVHINLDEPRILEQKPEGGTSVVQEPKDHTKEGT